MKDHKDNYENNTKCRLLNPSKSELGKVSKIILSKIVKIVKEKTNYNHWQNTSSVLTWFKNLQNKENLTFIQFDIVEFYPSISKNLLSKALDFAEQYVQISAEEKRIIFQTKKTLLFNDKQSWIKKDNKDFNVSMGSWDGAEVCEIVGLFLLSKLQNLAINLGLYRDDGLGVTTLRPRLAELEKQKVIRIMNEYGLKITAKANDDSVNFLDVNLNLVTSTFRPFMKDNDVPLYVHKQSNHPAGILQNIPLSVNQRLSCISSNEEVFNAHCKPYQDALRDSGYDIELKYIQPGQNQPKKRCRNRRISWFNPPFSASVKTKIGEKFLRALDRCFPTQHPLSKVLNRNSVKISYKCMPNIKQAISKHNLQIQKKSEPTLAVVGCNCRPNHPCPMAGNCLAKEVIYKAKVVELNGTTNTYTGLTGNTFKERFNGHSSSFRNRSDAHKTTLSTHIWKLKDEQKNFHVDWSIIDRGRKFNPTNRKCNLCLKEKYHIIFQPSGASLNKRSELFSVCRHRWQQLLANV